MTRPGLNKQVFTETLEVRTLLFLMAAVVIMFLLRSIWTSPIEIGGDAVRKFIAAAEILRSGDWALLLQDHHSMRWGVILPQIFVTWIVGTRYEVYYILPLLTFALYFVIIFYALKDHLNTSQKILLGVLLFVEPMSFRNSSQLMTVGPGVFYAISACYVLSAYTVRSHIAAVVAAALFFCAYGAHATYISFAAGAFLWLLFVQGSWKSSLVFVGTLIVLLTIECLVFNYLSGWELNFGRIEALFFGQHIQHTPGVGRSSVTFVQLITRWFRLPALDIAVSVIFSIGGLLYVSSKNKPKLPGFITCMYLTGLSFAIFVSFAVVDIDPLIPVQRLLVRYLSPFLPFAIVIAVYFLALLTEPNRKTWDSRMEILAGLLAFTIFVMPEVFDHSSRSPIIKIRTEAFFWKAEQEYTKFAVRRHWGGLKFTRQPLVMTMITQFKYPGEWRDRKSDPEAIEHQYEVKCVNTLDQIPLKRNYHVCTAEELERSQVGNDLL